MNKTFFCVIFISFALQNINASNVTTSAIMYKDQKKYDSTIAKKSFEELLNNFDDLKKFTEQYLNKNNGDLIKLFYKKNITSFNTQKIIIIKKKDSEFNILVRTELGSFLIGIKIADNVITFEETNLSNKKIDLIRKDKIKFYFKKTAFKDNLPGDAYLNEIHSKIEKIFNAKCISTGSNAGHPDHHGYRLHHTAGFEFLNNLKFSEQEINEILDISELKEDIEIIDWY